MKNAIFRSDEQRSWSLGSDKAGPTLRLAGLMEGGDFRKWCKRKIVLIKFLQGALSLNCEWVSGGEGCDLMSHRGLGSVWVGQGMGWTSVQWGHHVV